MLIPFNKPLLIGNELKYIEQAVLNGKISGDGYFTNLCEHHFGKKYNFKKCLLTTSCTDALEMCAFLMDIKQDDEIILPAYTFVSVANAFYIRGAKLIFADSRTDHPGIDEAQIEKLITKKTRAIVVVHYAGIACDMDKIMAIANMHSLFVIEDCAHAIDSTYKKKPLGSFGDASAFSFHETKNITSGEGGLLVVNKEGWIVRSEIIREKGTNRKAFINGSTNKYSWVDIGSSFLPSDITAAYLYAQLECLSAIQQKRQELWEMYFNGLKHLKIRVQLPFVPDYAENNAHIFYLVCRDLQERDALLMHLRNKNIYAVFHYQCLHLSPFFKSKYHGKDLPNAMRYNDCLLRLPLYYDLTKKEIRYIIEMVDSFFK